MNGNTVSNVRNCSEMDAQTLAYYLYLLISEMTSFRNIDEIQTLYNELVARLKLEAHVDDILQLFIAKQIKAKRLTPYAKSEHYRNPFDMKESPKYIFREDSDIYDDCGQWKTNTIRNVNMCRVLFCGGKEEFQKIVAMTFFAKPGSYKEKDKIPGKINIPAKFKSIADNTDSVKFIKDFLKLSDREAKLLQTAYRLQSVKEIYDVCNFIINNDMVSRIEVYSKCGEIPIKEIRQLLKSDQKLKSYGLLDAEGDMDSDTVDCILEQDFKSYFSDIIQPEKNTRTYDLKSYSVNTHNTELALKFLNSDSPCNILLYGAPGSGKTEYAKSLVKAAGLKCFNYKNEMEVKSEGDTERKALSRLNCYLSLTKSDSALIVDEAETVLKTITSFFGMTISLPQKGTVNKMLENSENKVIWILNYTDELDESTLRRFTYAIKFHEMPKATLRSIADSKLSKLKLNSDVKNNILDLCSKYDVTGASVDNMVEVIKAMDCSSASGESIIADVKDVLESNSTLLHGKMKIRNTVSQSYDLSVLNTSIPAPELVEMVQNAVNYNEENPDKKAGIRMLFYGCSGTGKTELARYLSERLGKKLLLKRASDILDKYVGESEQKIKAAFEEAEATDSILLFDEADTFFANRDGATQDFERTRVNEFLTQLEEYSGILVCTTNLRKIMDPAMQRRFHILTEFKPLNEKGINRLLNSFFTNYEFNQTDVAELAQYDSVTPGDFGALEGKMRFISKDKINSSYILHELSMMQSEKKLNGGGRIGFGA